MVTYRMNNRKQTVLLKCNLFKHFCIRIFSIKLEVYVKWVNVLHKKFRMST